MLPPTPATPPVVHPMGTSAREMDLDTLKEYARITRMRISAAFAAVFLLCAVSAYLAYTGRGGASLVAFIVTAAIAWSAFVAEPGSFRMPPFKRPTTA